MQDSSQAATAGTKARSPARYRGCVRTAAPWLSPPPVLAADWRLQPNCCIPHHTSGRCRAALPATSALPALPSTPEELLQQQPEVGAPARRWHQEHGRQPPMSQAFASVSEQSGVAASFERSDRDTGGVRQGCRQEVCERGCTEG